MAESDPKKIRPFGQAPGRRDMDSEEDPLVELARIVSEDTGFYGARAEKARPRREESLDRNAVSADLEAELLQELETSFASRNPTSRPGSRAAPQAPVPRAAAPRAAPAPRAPTRPEPPLASDPPAQSAELPAAELSGAELSGAELPGAELPADESDDLLRSIEEQLGQFERRAQVSRAPSARSEPTFQARVERREPPSAVQPARLPEPARPDAAGDAPIYQARSDSDDDGGASQSVLRPLSRVRDAAERGRLPERPVRPSPEPARGDLRPAAAQSGERAGLGDADHEPTGRFPLRRRDSGPLGGGPVEPARERPAGIAASGAAGWDQISDDAAAREREPQGGDEWEPLAETDYRQELRTTFGDLDEAGAERRRQPELGGVEAGISSELEPSFADPTFGSHWQRDDDGLADEPRVAAAAPRGAVHLPPVSAAAPRRGRRVGMLAAAGVLAVLIIGGGALTMMRSGEEVASGAPPVIAAPDGDVKIEAPAEQAQSGGDTVGEAVYNRVAGNAPAAEEQVVDGAEEPREISRIVLPPPQSEDGQNLVRQVGEGAGSAAPAEDEAIGPRRVRTYVVRPDGTISATDAAAQASAPPAPQQVAAVTPMEPVRVQTTAVDETGQSVPEPPAAAADTAAPPVAPEPSPPSPPPSAAAETPALSEMAAVEPVAPAPAPTADDNAPVDLLSAAPAEQPAAPAPAVQGGYVVQVSSQRSMADAQASMESLRTRYASVLGNAETDIQEADLGSKGIYYRVRVGPWASRAEAIGVCESLQAAGGSCFVTQ